MVALIIANLVILTIAVYYFRRSISHENQFTAEIYQREFNDCLVATDLHVLNLALLAHQAKLKQLRVNNQKHHAILQQEFEENVNLLVEAILNINRIDSSELPTHCIESLEEFELDHNSK